MSNYVALHTHSDFSLLDGYGKIEEYIKVAKELNMIGIGLCDHGTASGLYEFITKAQKAGIIPVPGVEFYLAPENPEGAKVQGPVYYGEGGNRAPKYDLSNGAYTHITMFAYNNKGLENLFKLTSLSWKPENFYFKPRIDMGMIAEHYEGLIVTSGCPGSEINKRFLLGQDDKAYEFAGRLKSIFGENMYIELMDHKMPDDELERILIPKQIKLSKDLDIPLIATNDSHYVHKEDAEPHERILAVSTKSFMKEPPRHKGGKRFSFSTQEYHIKTYDEMRMIFTGEIGKEALANTEKLTKKCEGIKLEYDPHLRPEIEIPEGYTPPTYFQKLIYEGFLKKRGNAPKEIQEESIRRIQEEFQVIHSNDFITYFLVVHDYIDYAHKNGIGLGAGRGCFVPGSKVKSNTGSMRNIENIKIGDKVQTHDTTYQIVEDVFTYDVEDEDMIILELSNGRKINATADHLIFHKDKGFIMAEDFVVGDIVLGPKGRREKYTILCDCCEKEITIDKQEYEKRIIKGHYKPVGEYWCYDCVKSRLHKIPAVKRGLIKGTVRNKDVDVKQKMSKSLKKHWEENYDERIEKWHAYMETPEYDEYRKQRREYNLKLYSDPKMLEKLAKQGRTGYKSGYFTSYQQNEMKIYYASSYELKALTILETDSKVESFNRCKRRIPYIKPSTGLEHSYLPDLEVNLKDGTKLVIEVKAEWQLKEEDTIAKMEQAEQYFKNKGIKFEIWSESTFERLNDDWHNDIEIISIERYKYTGKVHDLQVANVHNYNVEGVTVHNSVGGSEIAYVLDISNTDPIRYDLLFERFLSPGRGSLYQIDYVSGLTEEIAVSDKKRVYSEDGNKVVYVHELNPGDLVNYGNDKEVISNIFVKQPGSAPDVDTDFHTEGREQVVQYCVDKYGADNVANIITFGTFKAKRAFKAMCTINNVPFALANKASSYIPGAQGAEASLEDIINPDSPRYNEGIDFRKAVESPMFGDVVEIASKLDGRISETGVHPCGVVISNKPLAGVIPLQVRQSDGKLITQWEYPELEALGLIKMDFLGLELVDTVQQTIENIKLTNETATNPKFIRTVPVMQEIIDGPMDDPATYKNLQEGHTVGIFQLGSPGVRDLLKRAKPTQFMDIATITALYRPGPMSMNSHLEWADRVNGSKEIISIDKDFKGTVIEDILSDTVGVLVYQESLMQIATRYAGMTPYESDLLRKAMGKKKMDLMMSLKPKFVKGAIENGSTKELAEKVWETMEGFAAYGFNKSHSVSYAINIYQSIYLKTHYPSEFMAALIQQGFSDPNKTKAYIQEAMRMKLRLGPVSINNSQVQMASTGPDPSNEYDIVFGFSGVKQISNDFAGLIVKERNDNGLFTSVADFIKRMAKYNITTSPIANLALAGAFDEFGVSRKLVHEKASMLVDSGKKQENKGLNLFDMLGGGTSGTGITESIEITGEDFSFNEMIKKEADTIGMFVSGHPISRLGHIAKMYNPTTITQIKNAKTHKDSYKVLGTVTQIASKTNKSGNKSIAIMFDDGTDIASSYLPRELVHRIEKYEELDRMEKAKEKNELDKLKQSETMLAILNDTTVKPLESIELNGPYVFTISTRRQGDNINLNVIDIEKLLPAQDGSLPFEIRIDSKAMLTKVYSVVKKHENKKGAYVRIHTGNNYSDLEVRVKLSLDFIMDMESAVGKNNVITEGI